MSLELRIMGDLAKIPGSPRLPLNLASRNLVHYFSRMTAPIFSSALDLFDLFDDVSFNSTTLEDFIKNCYTRGYILYEELYPMIFAAFQNNFAERYQFIAESIANETTLAGFIYETNVNDPIAFRENLNCSEFAQILQVQDDDLNWHEEFGFFLFPEQNLLVSRSIAILEDHAPVVVAVNGSDLSLDHFKVKTPEVTSGYLIEGKIEAVLVSGLVHDAVCRTAGLDLLTTVILV